VEEYDKRFSVFKSQTSIHLEKSVPAMEVSEKNATYNRHIILWRAEEGQLKHRESTDCPGWMFSRSKPEGDFLPLFRHRRGGPQGLTIERRPDSRSPPSGHPQPLEHTVHSLIGVRNRTLLRQPRLSSSGKGGGNIAIPRLALARSSPAVTIGKRPHKGGKGYKLARLLKWEYESYRRRSESC